MRVLAAALCSLLLAGCPSGSSDPTTSPTPVPSSSAEPMGTVRFGMLGAPETLDPYGSEADHLTWMLGRPVYPSLFRSLPDGSTEPYLGELVEAGPRSATVRLRDLRWSNGREVTVGDVISSWNRAGASSGFSEVRSMVADGRLLKLSGRVEDWERTLATRALVLPSGKPRRVAAGPFFVGAYVPGSKVVLEPSAGSDARLERIEIVFVDSVEIMIAMLENGDLDAAAVPSSVNLGERLDALDLAHESLIGDEGIVLREGGGIEGALDLRQLHEGLIRTDGEIVRTARPFPRPGEGSLVLSAPSGDELLLLLQEAIQIGLSDRTSIEIVQPTHAQMYGRGVSGPSLLRSFSPHPQGAALFRVATYLVWRRGAVKGLEVNPTADGPLWNAQRWSVP